MEKNLPLGIQDLKQLITRNYLYVDKTELIYKLLTQKQFYFLARPRRFGKSLLISTLYEIFSGDKDLFKDLWIGSSDYSWPVHPIIRIDLSSFDNTSVEKFEKSLNGELCDIGSLYNLTINPDDHPTPNLKLKYLVTNLAKQAPVVILIDEYDAPLIQNFHKLELAYEIRDHLKTFYSAIKSLSGSCRFIFFTGVSKFSHTSVLSGMNILKDISAPEINTFGTLLGYTEAEVQHYFEKYIEKLAEKKKLSYEQTFALLKSWYNGYLFSEESKKVYSPYSLLNCLDNLFMNNYWYTSATPTFLIQLLLKKEMPIEELEGAFLSQTDLAAFEIDQIPVKSLLYQTGYLTLNQYNASRDAYSLRYPNLEVKISFARSLIEAFSQSSEMSSSIYIVKIREALLQNRIEDFIQMLYELFARVPYDVHMNYEKYYQTIFYSIFLLLSLDIDSEVTTNKGRIDIVSTTPTHIYIVELKKDKTGADALAQIHQNKYYEKYLQTEKKITLIGMAFDSNLRNISNDSQIEIYKE